MGGLVVAFTGKNPIKVYHAVFNGTGINWFFHVGNHHARVPFSTHHMWFPWDTASVAAGNLQQTLLLTTPIILTALALAFAFRCGLFNIGGQGQYIAGTIFAVWLGTSFVHLNPWAHVILCLVAGTLAGAAWAGIAGHPQGDGRGARGGLDDHAQLDRVLGRLLPVRRGWAAAGLAGRRSRSRTTSPKAPSCRSSGGSRSCRASRSGSSSRSGCSSSTG